MKLKGNKCGDCGSVASTIVNVEKYHVCRDCLGWTDMEKFTLITRHADGQATASFYTDCKHLTRFGVAKKLRTEKEPAT